MTGRRHARGGSGDSNFNSGERGLSFGQQSARITERRPAACSLPSATWAASESSYRSRTPATASIPPVALARPWYVPRCAPLERGQVAQSALDVLAVVFISLFVSLLATSVGAAVYLICSAPFR